MLRTLRYQSRVHLATPDNKTACGLVAILGLSQPSADPVDCATCIRVKASLETRLSEQRIRDAWFRGDLRHLMDETQLRINEMVERAFATTEGAARAMSLAAEDVTLEALKDLPEIVAYLLCSRKLGKSAYCSIKSLETCIRKPRANVQYFAPAGKDVADIVEDIMERVLLKGCPEEIRPKYNRHLREYVFEHNGSKIQFEGVNDGRVEDKRGPKADLAIGDECGSWDRFTYALESVIKPMTITTGGKILLATTPSVTMGHPSKAEFEKRKESGAAIVFTLMDSQRIAPVMKAKYLVEAGEKEEHAIEVVRSHGKVLPKETTAQREYFCMFVTDAGRAVLPEWAGAEDELTIHGPVQRPTHFHAYCSMDPGIVNQTAILWAFYDFQRGVIVVEAEKFVRGTEASAVGIADVIHAEERRLWSDSRMAGGFQQPVKRVSDTDKRLLMDLSREHDLAFRHADKQQTGPVAGVKLIRDLISLKQIEVHESCVILRRQMREALWNKNATDFDTEEDGGHYDGIAALKYLVRAVDRQRNPFPVNWAGSARTEGTTAPLREAQREPALGLLANTPFSRRVTRMVGWRR